MPESPEQIARGYLREAFDAEELAGFRQPDLPRSSRLEFELKNQKVQPLTRNRVLKFDQRINDIPVYGAEVEVELDEQNDLVSILSALSDVENCNPEPQISREEAVRIAVDYLRIEDLSGEEDPALYFYPAPQEGGEDLAWKLVYFFRDVRKGLAESEDTEQSADEHFPDVVDLVIDAHTGKVLLELPRIHAATAPAQVEAEDDGGVVRRFWALRNGAGEQGVLEMIHNRLNVQTYSFGFDSYRHNRDGLPGRIISNPPSWPSAGVSAHWNVCKVADFFCNVLKRNGVDDKGYPFVSTVDCVRTRNLKEWANAAWLSDKKQMIYGQVRMADGRYRSFAHALDIVAHEITHGITAASARLEYAAESGALNESYSDIFAIIISNWENENILSWDWRLGEDLRDHHWTIRNFADPDSCGQPAHMDDYRDFSPPYDGNNDYGGVHINSGIHNKAAHLLMTTTDEAGKTLFSKTVAAQMFYLALLRLRPAAGFTDSFLALEISAKELLRGDDRRNEKIAAIGNAFRAVGILQD